MRLTSFALLPLLLLTTLNTTKPTTQAHTIKGSVVSKEICDLPHFQVYYKGMQTESNDDGFFTIPTNKPVFKKCSMLLCKDFQINFDSVNTIKNLSVYPQKEYRFFEFTQATEPMLREKIAQLRRTIRPFRMRLRIVERQLARQQGNRSVVQLKKRKLALTNQLKKIESTLDLFKRKYLAFKNADNKKQVGHFWFIEEKRLGSASLDSASLETPQNIIPKNCIIVCMNPKNIRGVENWPFALPQNFVGIPRIILKNGLETRNVRKRQSITRSAHKAKLTSLEKKVFHETKLEEVKYFEKDGGRKVSLLR